MLDGMENLASKETLEEYTVGEKTQITARFRAFDSFEEGIEGYFIFLFKGITWYDKAKNVTDPLEYVQALKDAGYATDSKYVEKVMKVINDNNLKRFDKGGAELQIKKQLLSERRALEIGNGTDNPRNWIAVHQTDNPDRGANAAAHARLQENESLSYGWHWQVDDTEAIQSFDHDYKIFCQGDGTYGKGNNEAISVEICMNSDGDYNLAVENGAKLVARLMKEEDIDINHVKQHNFFSGKNCPSQIRAGRNGITWDNFLDKVKMYLGDEIPELKVAQTESKVTTNYEIKAGIFSNKIRAKELIEALEKAGFANFDLVETEEQASIDNPEDGFEGNYICKGIDGILIREQPAGKKIGVLEEDAHVSIAWITENEAWGKLKYKPGFVAMMFMEEIE